MLIIFLDREVKIFGSMPSLSFMKHLINTIVFHNTASQLGRPDLFITMPGHHYEVCKKFINFHLELNLFAWLWPSIVYCY